MRQRSRVWQVWWKNKTLAGSEMNCTKIKYDECGWLIEIKSDLLKDWDKLLSAIFWFSKIWDRHRELRIFIGNVWILFLILLVKRYPFISKTITRSKALIYINAKFNPLPINVRFLIVINWHEAQNVTVKLLNVNLEAI